MQLQEGQYYKVLFPYAYNILGSAEDARDVIGDVLIKHLVTEKIHKVQHEKNYLIKSVINLAVTTKNRQRRILREGEVWLPEPVATDDAADRNLNLTEILSYSLLVLLERLNATERAVFILRESFDYTHEEIASALSLIEDNSRQLLRRAKEKLYNPSVRKSAKVKHEKQALENFLNAIQDRDTKRLEELMAADIRLLVDGGGKVPFIQGSCQGAQQMAQLERTVYERYLHRAEWVYTTVNHQPAFLSFVAGRLVSCQIFDVHTDTGKLLQIHAVLDPQKLMHFHQNNSFMTKGKALHPNVRKRNISILTNHSHTALP